MIKLLVGGDYYPQYRIAEMIEKKDYSFFDELAKLKNDDNIDFTVINLECPIARDEDKPIDKNGPNLKCSQEVVLSLKHAQVDMVTMANNHILDYGSSAMMYTRSCCERAGIQTIGIGNNISDAGNIKFIDIKSKRIAFVNCCEHEFSTATNELPGANPLNPIQQFYAIQEAKKKADYVIVIVHGGHEYFQLPSLRMKETYRFFVDAGADVVLNHHQHCYSGFEIYKKKPIFYGLGNLCFDSVSPKPKMWNEGILVELTLDNDNSIEFKIIPFQQGTTKNPGVQLIRMDNMNEMDELNAVISDDITLRKKLDEYYASCKDYYETVFGLFSNRWLSAAYSRHLLPSFLTSKAKLVMENHLSCESHLDRVQYFMASNRKIK